MTIPGDYSERLQSSFAARLDQSGSPEQSADQIAELLISQHSYRPDEYVGSPDELGYRLVHIPDQSGTSLPGRANPVEAYFTGHPEQLLMQRLLMPEKIALEI